jgi:hypothetical protein
MNLIKLLPASLALSFALVGTYACVSAEAPRLAVQDAGADAALESDAGGNDGVRCTTDADCQLTALKFIPAGCGVAICQSTSCKYLALDNDGDGFPTADCTTNIPSRKVEAGTDCDDANSKLYPGASLDCVANGKQDFVGAPKGTCKRGKLSCDPANPKAITTCVGYIGPAKEDCTTLKLDEDCDGSPTNGCTCTAVDDGKPCGSSVGECVAGVTKCTNNTLACVGAKLEAQRDCMSAKDNDCNGMADNQEAECKCDGIGIGVTAQCPIVGNNATGNCRPGKRQCQDNKGSAVWSACSGAVGPTSENCSAPSGDADCDGAVASDQTVKPAGRVCSNLYLCDALGRIVVTECGGTSVVVGKAACDPNVKSLVRGYASGACDSKELRVAVGGNANFSGLGSTITANKCCPNALGIDGVCGGGLATVYCAAK